jgi:hypothetical protein
MKIGFPILLLSLLCLAGCSGQNAEPFAGVAKRPVPSTRVDSFGLPLVIQIDAPAVPPEIAKPSQPLPPSK